MNTETWQRPVTVAAVGVVAGVAATVSYAHMYEVARAAGEQWRAGLLPLSVDGLVIAASLSAWQARRRGEELPFMTTLSLTVGLLVSIGANVAVPFLPPHAEALPGGFSAVVAAWPAIALGLAFEQLLRLRGMPAADGAAAAAQRAAGAAVVDRLAATAVWAQLGQAPASAAQPRGGDQVFAAPAASFAARQPAVPLEIETVPSTVPEDSGDERQAARELVREQPQQWTGKTLSERFGKSERWGRDQIKAARDEAEVVRRPRLVAVDE